MNSVHRWMRRICIVVVAAASVVAGMVAVWRLAPRDVMAGTPTWVYLAVLALLLCPVATVAAWAWDRKAAVRDALQAPAAGGDVRASDQARHERATGVASTEPPIVSPPQETHEAPRRANPGSRHRVVRHVAK